MRSPDICIEQSNEIRALEKRMAGVTLKPLSRDLFRPLQLTRNNGHYGFLMQVCEMVLELALPEKDGIGSRFVDVLENEVRMSDIYEKFVRNFYRTEQNFFSVGREEINWDTGSLDPQQASYLPTMRTDVTLRSPFRTIVIDAKFCQETLVSYLGGRPKIQSGHLYQLLAYLRNMEKLVGPDADADGVLLYPSVNGTELRLDMLLAGHRVRVWSIDMSQPWQHVHDQLLDLIGTPPCKPASRAIPQFQ
jgi:5-methylcytosine-specific restriction enzyme subunit McrC